MRFTKRNNRVGREGTRSGFSDADVTYLNRQTHTPKTRIISSEELEGEPETRQYWCVCKSPLTYLKGSDTCWRCDECLSYYDISIQDSPIKDPTDFKLIPYQQHYPTSDDNIFFESIDLNKDDQ